ncbi:pheromone processing carboxypeptidase Kex1 [Histoplasma capsulatum var. duboisii H88]|uniref:Pheromone-processing carboxypeptidase KEX1 n=1 Tax=Ajellomyces capsulatus (strain H88) TaxID=544711 RepID=F0US94_AJEC8|nr:pheromone processing carboxypeptidase Kex1 [Histoplasma capsulatum var. duboisii H88]QSS54370.1 pheromone processing carboxypeptidase Kex1 [Histoplasma capsulatum var. duboisii H88]
MGFSEARAYRAFGARSTWLTVFLALANSLAVSAKCAADYFVDSLPGQPDSPQVQMHAGHIEINHKTSANLFFWHVANQHIADKPRTVIWLNGGPGCSSEDGALMEIGPYRVTNDHMLNHTDGSWDEFANLLFVDQPVGTGFSYVSTGAYVSELGEMASQFVTFLEKWFELFPHYEKNDLYFAGESYAGQYIPYIARAILDRNKKGESLTRWKLKGLLIGNGWISPRHQYLSYLPYAYQEGIIQGGTDASSRVEAKLSKCLKKLNVEDSTGTVQISACEDVLQAIIDETHKGNRCINMYDIRLTDEYSACGMNWPPDLENIEPYLRFKNVTEALHINSDKQTGWSECSGAVGGHFRALKSKPSVELLPGLLEEGLPILLFSGQKDLICNHIGTEDLIKDMKWSGGTGFELSPGVWAPRQDWTFEGESAGFYQQARNLTYVLFYNASHMVPFNYPRRSREMLDRFMGVDIADIGGNPADSRIDGEKGPATSVGAHPNSTAAAEREKEKVKSAMWKAYYKSGEVALIVVAIAAVIWGVFIWRSRQKHQDRGYEFRGIYPMLGSSSSGSLPRYSNKRGRRGHDVEAVNIYEAELDERPSRVVSARSSREQEPYVVGDEDGSDVDDDTSDERKGLVDKP